MIDAKFYWSAAADLRDVVAVTRDPERKKKLQKMVEDYEALARRAGSIEKGSRG
jgi:hypothetical protein